LLDVQQDEMLPVVPLVFVYFEYQKIVAEELRGWKQFHGRTGSRRTGTECAADTSCLVSLQMILRMLIISLLCT